MKDPAFLFYSDNFMSGTMFMTDEQVGKYIRLLCAQHLTGRLSEEDMIQICKTRDEKIFSKFTKDESGKYYNIRLDLEINKRKEYSKSRSENRSGKGKKDVKKTSKSYVKHMGNGNEDGNEKRKKPFIPPSKEDVIQYFKESGYSELIGERAFKSYDIANWIDSKGNPVKNWKQKMINVWFRDEHKITTQTEQVDKNGKPRPSAQYVLIDGQWRVL